MQFTAGQLLDREYVWDRVRALSANEPSPLPRFENGEDELAAESGRAGSGRAGSGRAATRGTIRLRLGDYDSD